MKYFDGNVDDICQGAHSKLWFSCRKYYPLLHLAQSVS